MLLELSVQNLGVIESSSLVLGPGVTVLTGETGAGKTMVVQAIQLLTGGRADPSMVRNGADQAVVEGRFQTLDGDEIILGRVIPADGRSRAYLDGGLAGMSQLSEIGLTLVDLHGQHEHQSLLQPKVQRSALDQYGQIDLGPLVEARSDERRLLEAIEELGGDARSRAHEIDLLKFQVEEMEQAQLDDPNELNELAKLEELLADASAHIESGSQARESISGDDGLIDSFGTLISNLADRAPYRELTERLRGLQAEVTDVAELMRDLVDSIEDDPQRLTEVRERRQLLLDLQRKYGDTINEVIDYRLQASQRLEQLQNHEANAAELEAQLVEVRSRISAMSKQVAKDRRASAPLFSKEVSRYLPELALENAELSVEVRGEDPADDVEIMFRANSGSKWHGLSRVASGGELARVMLSLRLVLTSGPPSLVFDEVDAGIGGSAALAVGKALGRLGGTHQVLVVTHLPQVAAYGDRHLVVDKKDDGSTVVSTVTKVEGEDRVRELTRMLAGQPDSASGNQHAAELLARAHLERSDK
tara:strand:+ start:1226 stop:2821 length:1596 start_codon:yes stop_codon:yes gene_type:complete